MAASRRRMLAWLAGWPGLSWAAAQAETAAATPLDVRLDVPPGEMVTVEWQGKPVFLRHRTPAEIARERAVPLTELRDPEPDQARAERPEWVVVEGVCTHGGCIPNGPLGDYGGWYCFCHGSQFDTAGRVRAGPARENLKIPPYQFVDAQTLRLGEP